MEQELKGFFSTRIFLQEIQSIRSMLRRRGLTVTSVRKVCRNSSSQMTITGLTTLMLIILALMFKSS